MGLYSALRELWQGRAAGTSPQATIGPRHSLSRVPGRGRRCQFEHLEPRQMLSGEGLAPPVILGGVYFEEATGDDSQPDVIQVSFAGGAAGTTLDRLVIDGDKLGDGLSIGDVIFDTADGGLGAFKSVGLSIVSAEGFDVESVSVEDGGSQIAFAFSGFEAGESLEFTVDTDEVQFVDPEAGDPVEPDDVDVNSLVEGAEFQRSRLIGEFSAPHHVDLTLEGVFWDAFDDEVADAQAAAGSNLDLPDDAYSSAHEFIDRTAGAVAYASQVPLATISGWVYHDRDDDGQFDSSEDGIGGVTLELLQDGTPTGITTITSTDPERLGHYEFIDLLPGNYGVREVQPDGYLDGQDTPGSHGGTAADESGGRADRITGAVVDYGDDAVDYNFGELLAGSIAGHVQATTGPECDFENPEILLAGVRIDLLDASGTVVDTTLTDENGQYRFNGLAPGEYTVREHQPDDYYDGMERVGTAGGTASDIGDQYSVVAGIQIGSDVHAVNYDFCEHVGVTLSGYVYHDRSNDGSYDQASEQPIEDVEVKLLNANQQDTGLRATTDADGYYEFENLAAGAYTVVEVHPAGWLDGLDTPGNLGGVADSSPPGDTIRSIEIQWGQKGLEYNFGELLPGSIRGQVVVSTDPECDPNDGEPPIAGVQIDLLDQSGTVIDSTVTDDQGEYEFTDLRPGTYSVVEHQPDGYFDGKAHIGSGNGTLDGPNSILDIGIGSDRHLVEYDFCEEPPVSIAGHVQATTGPDCDFDNPEILLSGVVIELRDANGALVATTTTDEQGEYRFSGLRAGEYEIHELQPEGYYDGMERAGTAGGVLDGNDTIRSILLKPGVDAVNYDFCEHVGVMLSGYVYHDRSNDGVYDVDTEEAIADVAVKLLDADQQDTGLRATTDANGQYKFNNLAAGRYTVVEVHPEGWLDGLDTPGNLGGVADDSPGDTIRMIEIEFGQSGTDYNFGELLPGSIRGSVHVSTDPDCDPHDGEPPIEDVRIDLLDAGGAIVATTTTDQHGEYEFTNLRPGTYNVVEYQPDDYFDGMAHVGSGDGALDGPNAILDISVGSDEHLVHYDFCEEPPAEISGYVFIDGSPIISETTPTAEQIAQQRDGTRSDDDTPLANVQLLLVDSGSGLPIHSTDSIVLPGYYPFGSVTVMTDAAGHYHFAGLRAGTYAVAEIQPDGLLDGVDTAGEHEGQVPPGNQKSGYPVNPTGAHSTPTPGPAAATIEQFRAQYGNDAIVRIPLPAGEHSQENNFSEVRTRPPGFNPPPEPPPAPPEPPRLIPPSLPYVGSLLLPTTPPQRSAPAIFGGSSKVIGYSWHLSVINAGQPRSVRDAGSPFEFASAEFSTAAWHRIVLDAANWTLATVDGQDVTILANRQFGHPEGMPVVGDFNGDAIADIGVFVDGQWFLDVNANGRWDEGDLWARLGTENDLPVTGDWDDDGKADIGIFGPAWPRDPWAISHEPGLPDAGNYPTTPADKAKNMPPLADEATSGGRVLKRTARGESRADVIDHVFHFGTSGDVPLAGDFNGDGIRTIGVFRDGQWHLDLDGDGRFTESDAVATFGAGGDLPVIGDFNGDGVDEIGVYRDGQWIIDSNGNRQIDAYDQVFELGGYGDIPVTGDWDGDGTDDPGTYQPGEVVDRVSRRAG